MIVMITPAAFFGFVWTTCAFTCVDGFVQVINNDEYKK